MSVGDTNVERQRLLQAVGATPEGGPFAGNSSTSLPTHVRISPSVAAVSRPWPENPAALVRLFPDVDHDKHRCECGPQEASHRAEAHRGAGARAAASGGRLAPARRPRRCAQGLLGDPLQCDGGVGSVPGAELAEAASVGVRFAAGWASAWRCARFVSQHEDPSRGCSQTLVLSASCFDWNWKSIQRDLIEDSGFFGIRVYSFPEHCSLIDDERRMCRHPILEGQVVWCDWFMISTRLIKFVIFTVKIQVCSSSWSISRALEIN